MSFLPSNTPPYSNLSNYPHAIYRITVNDIDISSTLTEGIFNAIALSFSKQPSIATLSTSNYPSIILKQIADRCIELKKDRPRLRWAFDNDKAGKKAIKKFHLRALQ